MKRAVKMRKFFSWKFWVGLTMLALSAGFYYLHYLIFHDAHHIFIYLLGDVAFVFVEVLLVSLIIHHVLNEWEKRSHLKKLTMVIEVFFSEFGKHLLVYLSNHDRNIERIKKYVTCEEGCCDLNFKAATRVLRRYKSNIDIDKIDFSKLSGYLQSKREFLINLLQNPTLLEHESFTETLMAVFHIAEELAARDLTSLSGEDRNHTKVDIQRAYDKLIRQWLTYMEYTKKHYPYFFLFAMKTNPFEDKNSWLEKWYEAQAANVIMTERS